jgi:hypothetical protein
VRFGAVRCGAVWCGAVRCGAVRCGAVRCVSSYAWWSVWRGGCGGARKERLYRERRCKEGAPVQPPPSPPTHPPCAVRVRAVAALCLCARACSCGAVRYGAVRCGAVRCGRVRFGAVRCSAVRFGAVRCGAVQCGAVRCDGARLSGRRAASDGGLMRSPGLEPGRWPSTRNASGGANAARTLPGACAFDVRRARLRNGQTCNQRFAIYIRWSSDWHAQAGVGQTPAEAGSGGGSQGRGSPQGRSTETLCSPTAGQLWDENGQFSDSDWCRGA